MRSPGLEHAFEVGDTVEVFCDHESERERVRGWLKGIVVQVDNKLVAVQFRTDVFLTDGWMVPDRILWYPTISEHIRTSKPMRAMPPLKPSRPAKKPAVKISKTAKVKTVKKVVKPVRSKSVKAAKSAKTRRGK
jgi:hypothetical protein